ncbi:MAG: hypothetical protein WKG52_08400 [Variovorax sp.]
MHQQRRHLRRIPSAVIEDDGELRRAIGLADPVGAARHAEYIAAVADHGDHFRIGLGQLQPDRGIDAPAQPAAAVGVVAAGPAHAQRRQQALGGGGFLEHDDGPFVHQRGHGFAQLLHVDRAVGRCGHVGQGGAAGIRDPCGALLAALAVSG